MNVRRCLLTNTKKLTALIDADWWEEWKPIPGYEGYYHISNKGVVISDYREVEGRNGVLTGKIKATRRGRYETITLYRDGVGTGFLIHRLVAMTFLPNPFFKKEINHIDGDRFNNRLDNLEWVTRKENSIHSTHVLKKNRGENNSRSKLNEHDVIQIKLMLLAGHKQTEIGHLFNVTNHAIHRIAHGYNWSWLDIKDRNTSCLEQL